MENIFESFDYEKMARELEPNIENLKRRIEEIRSAPSSNSAEKSDRICALESMLIEAEIEKKEFLKRAKERRRS